MFAVTVVFPIGELTSVPTVIFPSESTEYEYGLIKLIFGAVLSHETLLFISYWLSPVSYATTIIW